MGHCKYNKNGITRVIVYSCFQCILVELDFIAQTFSIALSSIVAYALLVVASDSKGSIEDEHLPTSTVYVFWAMEVSITVCPILFPLVKDFRRTA